MSLYQQPLSTMIACFLLSSCLASVTRADSTPPVVTPDPTKTAAVATDAAALQSDSSNWITKQFGPFKFTAGPNNSGAFAANLDGKGEKDASLGSVDMVENVDKFWFPASYNIGYGADGTWTTDSKAPSNFSLSL